MTDASKADSFTVLTLIAERLKPISFPDLTRPHYPAGTPATVELVNWGAQLYCYAWTRHVCTLLNGIVTLANAGNIPSARIVARSVYELSAHIYYLKKHLKQHLDAGDVGAAFDFLLPIGTGSRYIKEQNPEDSELFPSPPHIAKAIKCFQERLPPYALENYSYLSEFCHPNLLTFMQYYEWTDPHTATFADKEPMEGIFGPTTGAVIQGLMTLNELLWLTKEKSVNHAVLQLLETIGEVIKKP